MNGSVRTTNFVGPWRFDRAQRMWRRERSDGASFFYLERPIDDVLVDGPAFTFLEHLRELESAARRRLIALILGGK